MTNSVGLGFSRGNDCLNTIRLIAALQVIYGHCLAHLNLDMPETLTFVINFFHGVPIFFTLSGFLIWFSIGRSKTFIEYCRKRFWRIYPELWIAVIFEVLVILLLYDHDFQWFQFFSFILGQCTLFQFWTPDFLRDYGCGTPNGALWTICVLIQFYLVSYHTYKYLHNKGIHRWILVFIILVMISIASEELRQTIPTIIFKLYRETFIPFYWMFILGAFTAEYSERIFPIVVKVWYIPILCSLIIMIVKLDVPTYQYGLLRTIFLFFACLGIGYSFPAINVKTDISYSLYIYHMTIVNAMIVLGFKGQWYHLVIAVLLTCIVSYISTITIGTYSLKRKKKVRS